MKVVALIVTAQRRDFRRVGRDFKLGEATKVDLTALTTVQAEYLLASNPRDLVVEKVFDAPAAPPVADGIGTSPSEPTTKRGRGK